MSAPNKVLEEKELKRLGLQVTTGSAAVPKVDTKATDLVGTTHTVPQEEKHRFVEYINVLLKNDKDLQDIMPIDPSSDVFFERVKSGILLCKVINAVAPGSIDVKKMHTGVKLSRFDQVENHNLAIAAAKKLGVQLINIGVIDLQEGKPHLILGLIWQILKVGLVNNMTSLVQDKELVDKLKKNPQEVMLNWFNDILKKAGSNRVVKNLATDINDSECYTILLNYLAPNVCTKKPLEEKDLAKRAELFLQEAHKVDLRYFVSASDIVSGNTRLNFAFLANVFSHHAEILNRTGRKAESSVAKPAVDYEKIIAELRAENDQLKRALAEKDDSAYNTGKLVTDLKIENDSLKSQLKNFQAAFDKSSGSAEELKKLKEKMEADAKEHANLLEKIRELEKKIADLEEKNETLRDQKKTLEKLLKESEDEVEELADKLDAAEKDLAEKDDNIKDLLQQISKLMQQLEEVQEKLKKYVYGEYMRNEVIREEQSKIINIGVKDVLPGCLFSGWLFRRLEVPKLKWKKRFFVLKDNHLFYFFSDKKSEGKGKSIRLNGMKVEEVEQKGEKDKKDKTQMENMFMISFPELGQAHRYLLAAETPELQDDWIKHLKEALKALPSVDTVFFSLHPEEKKKREEQKKEAEKFAKQAEAFSPRVQNQKGGPTSPRVQAASPRNDSDSDSDSI